jgi:hypothetical protein
VRAEDVEQVHEEVCILEYATKLTPCSFFDGVGNIAGEPMIGNGDGSVCVRACVCVRSTVAGEPMIGN